MSAGPASITGTVVFTDIVGFTEFTALQGDGDALELLSVQERLVTERLPAGARIVKELGDGLLLWFPHAAEAVETCLGLQQAFEDTTTETLLPLWVRMGAHWGHQTPRGDDLIGHDVNVASRIAGIAGPGELLLSDATREQAGALLDGVCRFEEIGPVVMKGIPEPVRLFRAER